MNAWETNGIDDGFEVIVREQPLTEKPAQPIARGDVVLFSFMTPHLPEVHHEIKALKETGALFVGGGPHISGEQELAFQVGLDLLFAGAGEANFVNFGMDLLNNVIKKKEVYTNPSLSRELLNRYYPFSKYVKEVPPLEIMRGCFWKCAYCTTGRQKTTFRTIDSIRLYLEEMSRCHFQRINFVCPSALEYGASKGRKTDSGKIEEILELTRSFGFRFVEYGIFPSEVRPDTVAIENMRMLKKYVSHNAVTLGAQSGSNERLKELRRAHTTADIENATAAANDAGFLANLDFIIAYPSETPEERQETLRFVNKLQKKYRIRVHFHHFFPLSGSHYAFRFPSFLTDRDRVTLTALKKNGLSRDGWVKNEEQTMAYFKWLKENFPTYYSRYEG
jgi:B12-binding domain/radical SAM domain protein